MWKEVDGPGFNLTQRVKVETLTVASELGGVVEELVLVVVEVERPWGCCP